jgi:O-antigen/teichoic acid export membrane protein
MTDASPLAAERGSAAATESAPPSLPSSAPVAHTRGRALGAALWLLTGHGSSQILRLAGNLILTRLLFAEAFGVMQLVTVFLIGLHLFSDIGIGPGIVQSDKGDDPLFLDTAWTIQIVRGVVLYVVGVALSYPFALYYEQPSMFPILVAANTVSLFGGFQSTKIFTASRNLAQRQLSLLELGSQAIALVATVVCAYVFRAVWTLVVASLAYDLLRVVGSHLLLPGHRNRIRYDRTHARSMMRFGRWIFLSTVLTFFATQADRLVFGKLVPIAMLGIYGVASNVVSIAPSALSALANGVLFPMYARIVHSGGDLSVLFGRVRRPMLVIASWIMAGFIGGGSTIIDLLYDTRYAEAGTLVQILAFGGVLSVVEGTTGKALLAMGESRFMAAASAGKLVGMLVLIPLGHALYGFQGACAGYAASELGRYLVSSYAAVRRGLPTVKQDLRLFALLLVAAGTSYAAVELTVAFLTPNVLVRALAVFVVVTAFFAPLLRGLLGEVRALRQGEVPNSASTSA